MSDNKQMTRTETGTSPTTRPNASAGQDQQRAALPAVDVFEDAGGITVLADLPGVPKDQLDLKITSHVVTPGRVLEDGWIGVRPAMPATTRTRWPRSPRSACCSRRAATGAATARRNGRSRTTSRSAWPPWQRRSSGSTRN